MAYFFTFRYRAPQRVEAYTKTLADKIAAWKESFPSSTLSYRDEGDRVVVSDDRPDRGAGELTILTGLHRAVYLACDEVTTASQLGRALAAGASEHLSSFELTKALDGLVDEGLILRDGPRYLSLGLRQAG